MNMIMNSTACRSSTDATARRRATDEMQITARLVASIWRVDLAILVDSLVRDWDLAGYRLLNYSDIRATILTLILRGDIAMAARFCVHSYLAVFLAAVCFTPITGRASLYVSIEAPGVQATTVSAWYSAHGNPVTVNTETFDELSVGNHTSFDFNGNASIGTYTSPGIGILIAGQYGGAYGSNYAAVGVQSGTTDATLTLTAKQGYFGMWWSAGDPQN
jgi:hypothetical protein